MLETFKGKNILIDVWATWCGPCIEEFKYKSFLQPFIEEGNLKMLYISIDKQRWKNKWRENIKYNQLEGYHVLANDVLIKDMWEVLAGMKGAIPDMPWWIKKATYLLMKPPGLVKAKF